MVLGGVAIKRVDPAGPPASWCWAKYFAELYRRYALGTVDMALTRRT